MPFWLNVAQSKLYYWHYKSILLAKILGSIKFFAFLLIEFLESITNLCIDRKNKFSEILLESIIQNSISIHYIL